MSGNAIEQKKKKGFKIPHTFVLLFSIVIIMSILSYVIPAGQYDMVEGPGGRSVVDPDSFHQVEQSPISFMALWMSVTVGMQEASSIIFFILIVGGSFEIINATGAVEAGITRVALKMRNKDFILIPGIMVLFFVFGGTIGMSEECIAFVPIGIALARALGYDAIVGTAMVTIGAAAGFTAGFLNPFTVGVAQGIAELPPFSGITLRIILGIFILVSSMLYIMHYCRKLKKDPKNTVVPEVEAAAKGGTSLENLPKFTVNHALSLLCLFGGIVMLVVGVFFWDWYIDEIATVFLIAGVAGGFFGKMGPSKISVAFLDGARGILLGALVVGLARSILVVMTASSIIHTIIYGMASLIGMLPSSIAVIGMYIVQNLLNFFIVSGSGQAAVTMPIMTPLSDVLGINRQVAVLCFQLGDGFTNSIIPTSGSLMGVLSVGRVPYEKWAKWLWPLMLIWIAIGLAFVLIANAIGYGPF